MFKLETSYVRSLLHHKSFALDAIISVSGGITSRLIMLATIPYITRVYGPETYGIWVIILAFAGLALPLATLRYEIAIILAATQRMAVALIIAMFGFSTFACLFLGICFWLLKPTVIESVTGLVVAQQYMLAFAPVVLALLASQLVLQSWASRQKRFVLIGIAQMSQALIGGVCVIVFPIIIGATALAISLASIIGLLAFTITLIIGGADLGAYLRQKETFLSIKEVVVKFRVYALYVLPYSLSAGITERVFQLILASAYSISTLGVFYIARQIILTPVTLITSSLRQVIFIYSAEESDSETRNGRIANLLELEVAFLGPMLAFALVWLSPVLEIITGGKWEQLSSYAWWSMWPSTMLLLTGWLDRMFDILGRQRLAVGLQIVSDVCLLVTVFICVSIGVSALQLVASYSLVIAIYNLIWLFIVLILLGFSLSMIVRMIARGIVMITILWGLFYGLQSHLGLVPSFMVSVIILCLSVSKPGYKLFKTIFKKKEISHV